MSVPSDLPREGFLLCSFHSLSQLRQVVGKRFISFRRLTSLTHASERIISEMRVTTGSKREGVIIVVKSCKRRVVKGVVQTNR